MHVSIKMVEDIIRQDKLSRLYINERQSEDLAGASDGSSRFCARRKTTDIWLVSTDYDSPVKKEAGKRQSLYMFWLKLILIWGRINGDSCTRVIWDNDHTKTVSPTTNKVIINANKLKRTQDEHLSFNITYRIRQNPRACAGLNFTESKQAYTRETAKGRGHNLIKRYHDSRGAGTVSNLSN